MADPRFYDNRGPFTLAGLCAAIGVVPAPGADTAARIHDVASLEGAGPAHLAFCAGGKAALAALKASSAGFCLTGADVAAADASGGTVLLTAASPAAAFAAAALCFYPEQDLPRWPQQAAIDPTAVVGEGVRLAPGVAIGPGAEIGERTRIGPNTVIGRGVAIGRDCEVGSNVTISYAYVGDSVLILSGARIGEPGYGFVSGPQGHRRIPQLGRVIVQDRVEAGANSTIDRGMLGDTVIGEGTKIDNLVQIGHNCRIGRHCLIVAQVGLSGSVELGDFVVLGGQVGVADHVRIGDGARVAARGGIPSGDYPGGQDYGGFPLRPVMEWRREVAALALLAKRRKRDKNG
ncbi:MAG: UDP-3-O-(3-hydroxymyristoyl)glucosamine N-acyltransferase [Deltaproteobacteria bacterium]|nr:UDP-3-O-(3-hydroxymyristoyl)glucosamine N-acyltransferase [Deltaproteobacteria bacterium]